MHERIECLPSPDPDMNRLLTALRNEKPDRVPLLELAVDVNIVERLNGTRLEWNDSFSDQEADAFAVEYCQWWKRLGYDYVRISPKVLLDLRQVIAKDDSALSQGDRQWADSHHGAIESLEDFEKYPWPDGLKPEDYRMASAIMRNIPEGMGCIAFSGGVFEFSSELLGLENFFMAIYTDPELVEVVTNRVGQFVLKCFEEFSQFEQVKALWLGDDLGSKNATFVQPDFLREHIFPWYRKFTELAHKDGRPFMLHSCGNLASIMDQLIEAGVDAKHSYEDTIMPIEQVHERWGDRVAVLGGVDVDLLSRGSQEDVAARTQAILEACSPNGGYACGSGNSIASYVDPENYLTMIETVHRFNGRM